ncbi:MAG TPA: DNA mismatch repair endonuclease MutL [Dictyobacter sp.]|jgi:DNA mismatch repair protein MutL|nr:DNA mismatch repair endonuclease MutL [Dictyobacter sp.]
MPIRQLAPDVAAKIAAGEVVERPASVVKELIENSIDAGASQIRVDLAHGGLQLIRVTDNGSGIAVDELPLALERHATSKVSDIDDLEHIHSLGFRGEALASIAAVAEVTLVSRKKGEDQGAQIDARNGQISQPIAAASSEGTSITVRNLFSAVPARLKFLKSRNTEVSHCHHLLEQYALAYPEIRFSVFSENRQIFATPGDGKLSSVLVEVYGLQIAEQMVPIHSEEREDDGEYPVVTGYVSRPTCYKSTRQHISFFVNRRWVLSRMLTSAVEGAYHSLLLSGRHPIAVVNIRIDPSLLDVNVHPAKTEIRFLKERRVFAAILRAVREALLDEPEVPQWQPKGISARSTFAESQQVVQDDTEQDQDEAESFAGSEPSIEMPNQQRSHSQTIPDDNPWLTVTEEESGTQPPMTSRLWQSHVHSPIRKRETEPATERSQKKERVAPIINETTGEVITSVEDQAVETTDQVEISSEMTFTEQTISSAGMSPIEQLWTQSQSMQNGDVSVASAAREHHPDNREQAQQQSFVATLRDLQSTQTAETMDERRARHFPRLRVVGQVAQSYIVTEGEDGMYLIDQHAAHERIVLERMVASMKGREAMSQMLLTPIQLELSPAEIEAVEEHQGQLEHIGFAFTMEDPGVIEVRAVPSVLVKHMNARSLHDLLLEVTSPESLGDTETWEERALANVACKAAIKANYFLTVSEMREMLEQLEGTSAPFSCCHGRPTMVHFGLTSLSRSFERR